MFYHLVSIDLKQHAYVRVGVSPIHAPNHGGFLDHIGVLATNALHLPQPRQTPQATKAHHIGPSPPRKGSPTSLPHQSL